MTSLQDSGQPTRRKLRHAPVVEALLDIRVVPRPDASIDELRALDDHYRAEYPERKEKKKASFQFKFDVTESNAAPQAEATAPEPHGFMYSDKGQKNRVQIALNGFTQNVLAPYADFETLIGRARPNWEAFKSVTRPLAISRIAVRYINELRLPIGEPIESNLIAFPNIPPTLPQTVSDFALRLTIHHETLGARAIVNQVSQGLVDQTGLQVFLDIDAIIEKQIDIDSPELWDRFQALREFKNDIFFDVLSKALLEKYK